MSTNDSVSTPANPPKGSKKFLVLGTVAVITVGGYFGWGWLHHGKENTDDAQTESDVIPISTRVSGTVIKTAVQSHQPVKKGDLLVQLDPADYQIKVSQAEAELAAANAQAAAADAQVQIVQATSKGGYANAQAMLSGSNVGIESADAQIASARAAVAKANADLAKANIDLGRAQKLRASEAIPQAQLDTASTAQASATAQLASAQAMLSSASASRQAATSSVSAARARVDQNSPVAAQVAAAQAAADLAHARVRGAQAGKQAADLQLSYTKILAPADGITSDLAVHEGQLVQVGQTVVAVVPADTYVIANLKETQVGRVKIGQIVDMDLDAYPGQTFTGKVESLSPATGARFSMLPPDNASGNFVKVVQRVPVKIAWTNLPKNVIIEAGLSVDVTIHVE